MQVIRGRKQSRPAHRIAQGNRQGVALAGAALIAWTFIACASLPHPQKSPDPAASSVSSTTSSAHEPIMVPSGSSPTGEQPATDETQEGREPKQSAAIVYNVPDPANPEGQIKIESLGIVDLQRAQGGPSHLPMLHVLMTVRHDSGDLDWNLDTRLQDAHLDQGEAERPAFVRAPGQAPPFVRITAGQTQRLDLFYRVPPDEDRVSQVQRLSLDWQLVAGERIVATSADFTSIERVRAPPLTVNTRPLSSQPAAKPYSTEELSPQSRSAPVGIQRDWWQDPFADLPEPWRENVQ